MSKIPAIWCIDIEPDDPDPGLGRKPWTGFVAAAELVRRLRAPLAERSGRPARVAWFLRMDPNVERCYGRSDYVVNAHRALIDDLRTAGDSFGLHVHDYRWDEGAQVTYSDYADPSWERHCLEVSAEVYTACFGESPRSLRKGGYFLTEATVETAVEVGIEVDLTSEPGILAHTDDPSYGAYTTAPCTDFSWWPRYPHYPSRDDITVAARSAADAYPLLMIPLTSWAEPESRLGRAWRGLRRIPAVPPQPLNPWRHWESPHAYWDLVAQALDTQPDPHLALAIRSDPLGDADLAHALFEYLPRHPLAERLELVDPFDSRLRATADRHLQRGRAGATAKA